MHFVSIARSHCYPRLSGYRYHSPVPGEKKDIDPEHVLMPFLKCRFRIEKGTGAIRGFESQTIHDDEVLIRLGLILL